MSPWIELSIAVLIALVVSGFCSLLEAALYSVPVTHVEALAQSGRRAGHILRSLRRNVDDPISAILSLNTISHTAGAAVAGAAAAAIWGHSALTWFSAVFTLAILLFSEVLPKTIGVVYCKRLAPILARPLQWMVWLLYPMVWLCRSVTSLVSKKKTAPSVSEEELIVMTRLGRQAGVIEADEAEAIQNILTLESKTAREVMTPRSVLSTVSDEARIGESKTDPKVLAHSRLPVYHETPDDMIGVVLRHDILAEAAQGNEDKTVGELMRPVHFVEDSTPLDRLLRHFLEQRQHLFVVVGEFGGVVGVITLEDILEEILGKEIVDELDEVEDMRDLARQRRERLLQRNTRESGPRR